MPLLERKNGIDEKDREVFAKFCDLNQREPQARFSELSVFSGRTDWILLALDDSIVRLEEKLRRINVLGDGGRAATMALARQVSEDLDALQQEMKSCKSELKKAYNYSPQSYRLAEKYALLHSAATCIHVAVYTSDLQPLMADMSWLPACLLRVRRHLHSDAPYPTPEQIVSVFDIMQGMFDEGLMFGFMPIRVAEDPRGFCSPEHMNI